MPDLVMHHYFGRKLYSSLNEEIKEKIDNLPLYDFATAGPDPFFFVKFLNSKLQKESHRFGNFMHKNMTRDFFVELVKIAKRDNKMFSYLCGFIAHYALDVYCHPYVFYYTGEYDKENLETLVYRGLHTKLERAIDSYIIKKEYKANPNRFKIHKKILTLKKLNPSLKESFDDLFKVFGKDDGFNHVNMSVKYQRKFYQFIYDPFGIKDKLFKKLDNKTGSLDLSVLSYYNKGIEDVDIFNLRRDEWKNPADDSIVSRDTFFDLVEKAKVFAIDLINKSYSYIYLDEDINLDAVYTNLSYLTGLECEKSKEMRYFKNIFS